MIKDVGNHKRVNRRRQNARKQNTCRRDMCRENTCRENARGQNTGRQNAEPALWTGTDPDETVFVSQGRGTTPGQPHAVEKVVLRDKACELQQASPHVVDADQAAFTR